MIKICKYINLLEKKLNRETKIFKKVYRTKTQQYRQLLLLGFLFLKGKYIDLILLWKH